MNVYSLVVSNLGTIHTGHNRRVALREFIAACAESSDAHGRASRESVTLLCNGEPLRESMSYDVEVTDTFNGEANYCWARRYALTLPADYSDAQIMRAAKLAAGYSGHPGKIADCGDSIEYRPRGQCVVLFATHNNGES